MIKTEFLNEWIDEQIKMLNLYKKEWGDDNTELSHYYSGAIHALKETKIAIERFESL